MMAAEPAAEVISSPLSGGYLLIVLAEPHSQEHKQILLQRLAKGLCSWDVSGTQIDIESELRNIAAQCPQGEELRNGEKLIQLASDSLVTEILIHPQLGTLKQCMRNLLASFSRHRHVIHAGYTLSGTGSWILQDGVYELSDMLDVVQEPEVQRLLRAYDSITVDLHCTEEGQWAADRFNQLSAIKSAKISLNPPERWSVDAGGSSSRRSALSSFIGYISDSLPSVTLDHLLEPSDVVGNIRFNHPTLYVFPGGQGDSALFGISGFNILVDGGFGRKPCFWDFTRHLDRLDAVVMTRNNASSLSGLTGAVCRKASSPVYPQVGHFFCNLPDASDAANTPQPISSSSDPLTIHLKELCRAMSSGLESLQLKAQPLYRTASHEPINLYHKVGHGTLDMYVISPSAESAEVKELLRLWQSQDSDAIASAVRSVKMGGKELRLPLLDVVSVCALLVWHPADPNEQLTRLLFPGSAPQAKILEGLDKFKNLECLKTAVCMGKDMSSTMTTPKSPTKTSKAQASSSSPRHSATPAATASMPPTAAKKPAPVAKDNKEPSRPSAVKSSKANETQQPSSGSLTGGSRTGSGEIRVVKKTITAVAAKVAHKREPSKTRAAATVADNNSTTAAPAAAPENINKMKKDAVNNLKAVEAKVHSFKSPAAMKRAAEEKSNKKAGSTDPPENAKEHAVVKDIKERAMRSQSQSREKRSASSVRSSVNEEEKKAKLAAASKNKANDAAQASPVHKLKPKAKEATTAPAAKPTGATKSASNKPIPSKQTTAASTKTVAKESKPTAKSTPTPPPSSSTPSSKAVKRPVKVAAPLAVATAAAVASVAAVAVTAQTSEDEPIAVLEEMVTAVEAAQAASSPSMQSDQEVDTENAYAIETTAAVDESTILDAIESQIVEETCSSSEEMPVEADVQVGDDEDKVEEEEQQQAIVELEAEEEIITTATAIDDDGAAGNEEEENEEVVGDDNNEAIDDDSLEQIDHEGEEQHEDVQVETISASVAQEQEAIKSEPVNVGDGLEQEEEAEPSSLAFKDNDVEDQERDTVSPDAVAIKTTTAAAEAEAEEEDQCETEEEEMDIVLPNNEEEDQEEEQIGHEGIVLALEEVEPTVTVMTSIASVLMESQPQSEQQQEPISRAERDEDTYATSAVVIEKKESISKESTTATVQQSVIESIDSQVVHNVDEVVIEKPQTRETIEPMTVDVVAAADVITAASASKQESERALSAKSPEITLDSDKQSETLLSSLSSSISMDQESNQTSMNFPATERSRSTSPADKSLSIVSDQESVPISLNVAATDKSRSSSRTSECEPLADKLSISPVFNQQSERSRSTSPADKSVSPVFERESAQTLNVVETKLPQSRSDSQASESEVQNQSEKSRPYVLDQESAPTSLNVVMTERSRSTSPADKSISSVSDGESIASVNVVSNLAEGSRSASRADEEKQITVAAVMQEPLSSFSSVSTDQDSMTLQPECPGSRPASANEQINSTAPSKGLTKETLEPLSRPVSAVSEQSSSSRSGSRAADNNEREQEPLAVDECTFKQSTIGNVSAEKSWPVAANPYDLDEDSMTSMGSVVVEEFKADIIVKPVVVIAPDAPIRSPMTSPAKTSSLATPSQMDKEAAGINDDEDDDGIEVEEETFQREIKAKVDAVPITPTERDAPGTSGGAESLPHEGEDEADEKEKKEEKAIDVTEEKKDDKLESKSKEVDGRREAEVTQQQQEPSERKDSVQLAAAVASVTSPPIDPRTLQHDDDEEEVVEEAQVSKSDSKSQVEASPNSANKWSKAEEEANISLTFSDDYDKKTSPLPPVEAKETSMMDETIQFSKSHDAQVASAQEDHRINITPLTVTLESSPVGSSVQQQEFTVPSPTFSRSNFVVPITASTPIDGPETLQMSVNQMTGAWSSKESSSSSPPPPSSPRDVSARIESKLSAQMEMNVLTHSSLEGVAGTDSKVDQLITKEEVEVEEESSKSPASPLFQQHSSYVKGPMGNVMYEDIPVPSLSVSVETNMCSATIKPMSMADDNIGTKLEQAEDKKKEDVCTSSSMIQPPLHASYVKGPMGNVIYVSPLEAEIKQEPILQSKSASSPIPSQSPIPAESIQMEKCDPLAAFPPTPTIDPPTSTSSKEPLKPLVIDTPLTCKSVEEINQPKNQSELNASASALPVVTDHHLKPESLSTSSSASVTPKSPLSPNPSSSVESKFSTEEQINKSVVEKLESATAGGLQSEPSSLGSEATMSSYSERVTDQEEEDEEDLTAPSTPNKTTATSYLSGYEGVQIGASNKLSTIASSDGGQSCDSSIQHPSLDSNLSSRTYDKLAAVHHLHQPEDTAFSSGPSSWDEREMMAARPSSSTYIAAESLSDRSATSSISHITDDEQQQHAHGFFEKKEVKMADSSKHSISPVPSSPFSTTERDYEVNKDSLSSVHTSASSDYQLGVESKVDDSASSARSDYSDRSEREELRASLTPRSDVSSSASETTVGQIIQQQQLEQPVVSSVITQQQQQPVVVEVKSSKAELADPKLAPHNIWLKEKGASSSPNPFSDDDAEASSAIYYQQQQPHAIDTPLMMMAAQQQHSDLDSDHQSDSQSMIHTDEYYAQHGDMDASHIKVDYDEAHGDTGEAYLYDPEHDDDADQYDPYVAKYGDEYDDPYHHGAEQQHGDHENGNSTYHHFYDSRHQHLAAAYEDMNRNGNSRNAVVAALDPVSPTRLDVSNTSPQSTSPASVSPQPPMQQQQQQLSAAQLSQQHEETLASWGKPLGLPAPVAPVFISSNGNGLVDGKKSNGSPVKRATNATNGASKSAANGTNSNATPFYVDLAYIPHHSDPKYSDVDFFRRVRARHYVLSTLEPSPQVLDALLEGKQSWTGDDKELDVTIIPTYDSDALALWVSANEEILAQNRIDLAPSASRCTINLQDHETSCSAYRLEF